MSGFSSIKTKIVVLVIAVAAVIGFGTWALVANAPGHKVHTVTNSQHQVTQLSYDGENGVTALALLKQHATITTKHYSFGDLVTSIDGTAGNGPKYWTLYVNGKPSSVGASAYVTKAGDVITWKLQ